MLKFFQFPDLRKKVLITLGLVIVFRLLAHVPVPGVNIEAIRAYLQGNALLGLFDLFSGGAFQNFSLVTLGLAPYINVSIVIQLLTVLIPSLEELQKEGEYGREKINMYTRLLTVPMAMIEAYGIYFLLSRQQIINSLDAFGLIIFILTLTAGSVVLVWIGELITEYGIGNGISMLIFISIIGRLPASLFAYINTITVDNLVNVLIFLGLSLLVIAAVVTVNEGTRNVPIEYGRCGVRSEKITNFLPIKVNQVSVVPILFAVSMVMIPSMISAPLEASSNATLQKIGYFFASNFTSTKLAYNVIYFLLVLAFTYFYTSVQFQPEKIAEDVKKRGGFIPGIRPGKSTADYLKFIVDRITLAGAMFLGIIAILPFLIQSYIGGGSLSLGGTGLLIVVSVVLETIRQVESLTVSRSYDKFLR